MIKVYGDGLDALVAINLFLDSGHQVAHFSKSENPGGHFRGSNNCGSNFDLGMVLLEPDFTKGSNKDLLEYSGEFGRDSRCFLEELYSWLQNQIGALTVHPVYAQLPSGALVDDYFIGDSLEFLRTLDPGRRLKLREHLIKSIEFFSFESDLHPSNKSKSKAASNTPLIEVLKLIFGNEIYADFFKPFISKLSGNDTPSISSKDNRRVWMPNYYPESLLAEFATETEFEKFKIDPVVFLRPTTQQISDYTSSLDTRNRMHGNYKRVSFMASQAISDVRNENTVSFYNIFDFTTLFSNEFQSVQEFSKFFKQPKFVLSNSIDFTHFCLIDCDPKTVFTPNSENQILRYSLYKTLKGASISLESTLGNQTGRDLALEVIKSEGLTSICGGASQNMQLRIIETQFSSDDWMTLMEEILQQFKFLNQRLFLVHPEANSLNDNLLRGLIAFRKWNHVASN